MHAHHKSPALVRHALSAGLTTMIGDGHGILFGGDSGGDWTTGNMLRASDAMPMNFGFLTRGSRHDPDGIRARIAGADPIILREQWGAHGLAPQAISATFVHPSAIDGGLAGKLNLERMLLAQLYMLR